MKVERAMHICWPSQIRPQDVTIIFVSFFSGTDCFDAVEKCIGDLLQDAYNRRNFTSFCGCVLVLSDLLDSVFTATVCKLNRKFRASYKCL